MNVVIWGTGKKAKQLLRRFERVNRITARITGNPCFTIDCFLDSAPSKIGTTFFGEEVVSPSDYDWDANKTIVIIAAVKCAEILSYFDDLGKKRGRDYITLDDVLRWMYAGTGINSEFFDALGITDRYLSLKSAWEIAYSSDAVLQKMDDMWEAVQCAPLETSCIEFVQCSWIREMILTEAHRLEDVERHARWFLEKLGAPKLVGILDEFFGDDVITLTRWMPLVRRQESSQFPKTIGLFYTRMYNGGVERVLSMLIPIFVQHGYQVVLFTNVIDEEREYPLPKSVIRVVLDAGRSVQERCEEILAAVRTYHVDVFCSHEYTGRLFYELFCLQSNGIPVITEMHNCFSACLKFNGGKVRKLCRRMDAVVTLSRTDAMFWRLLGCRSLYIPNPVNSPDDTVSEYDAHTILWIQRVEQEQKQVFDLPDIMKYVVERIPDAKLMLVGASDTKGTEDKLRKMFEARGLRDHVIMTGYQLDVASYYKKAAVMLMTSSYEGFSMTTAEGKRYGVPLVLYDLPYLELLKDGRGYVSVPQRDKRAAADALVEILKDDVLRSRLSKDAQESIAAFCEVNLMKKWEKAFALAANRVEWEALTDEEHMFSEIERSLLALAEKGLDAYGKTENQR